MSHNRDKALFGRWRTAAGRKAASPATLIRQLFLEGITVSPLEAEQFNRWLAGELWQKYQDHCMDQRVIIMNRVNSAPIAISNGTVGKYYASESIVLPSDIAYDYEFQGLEELGLDAVKAKTGPDEDNVFNIQGIPTKAGDFTITIRYKYKGWLDGRDKLERKISFAVNPDPRTIWRDIPTPQDIPYYKPDTDCEFVKIDDGEGAEPRKDMVAASKRGRSHAHEGKARDDHFMLYHCPKSDWYIMAVADGAGSAKFSRKGSEVACKTVVDFCKDKLSDCPEFEKAIRDYNDTRADHEREAASRKVVGDFMYGIVGHAAYMAHRAINEVSRNCEDSRPRDFSTTLLLAVCKQFDFGWFIGSFWVGDGAMCIYNKDEGTFSLLGVPDEGEYSGQTRFLTMPEIFADPAAFYKRMRVEIRKDFTALMLMTDGVSDPMFGTDANLNNVEKWHELWARLQKGFPEDNIGGVELSDNNEAAKDQLLQWLDFWVPGEHDDRTIAILY